jgi:predicted nucleic acid-binding protein
MIAVDTNVVIRLLTGDDPAQAERARALFESETIFLPKTVILESEWVLRKLYRNGRSETLEALSALALLPNVRCEDEAAIFAAIACARAGMDFADALHLTSAREAQRFASFDKKFVKAADSVAEIAVFAL